MTQDNPKDNHYQVLLSVSVQPELVADLTGDSGLDDGGQGVPQQEVLVKLDKLSL